jgi:hypothetical protein
MRTLEGVTLGLILTLAPLAAGASPPGSVTFAPPGEGFSITFAPNPQPSPGNTQNGCRTAAWVSRDANYVYLAAHTACDHDITAASLGGDLNDFVQGTHATVLDQATGSWPAPDGKAISLRFTFRLPDGRAGAGVFVADGANGFGADAVGHSVSDVPETTGVVATLTILP